MSSFSIYTLDGSHVGDHSIILVQNFEAFPDVHPYVTFKIAIKPLAYTHKSPPYFEPPVPSLVEET